MSFNFSEKPRLTGDATADVASLANLIKKLTDALNQSLNNLDESNFSYSCRDNVSGKAIADAVEKITEELTEIVSSKK